MDGISTFFLPGFLRAPGVVHSTLIEWPTSPVFCHHQKAMPQCPAQHSFQFWGAAASQQLGRHLAFVNSFLETCQVELNCLLEQWWRHSVFLQGPESGIERCKTAERYLNALPKKYKARQNSPSTEARSKTSIPGTTVALKFLSWLSYISSSFHCVELKDLCISLMSGSLGISK